MIQVSLPSHSFFKRGQELLITGAPRILTTDQISFVTDNHPRQIENGVMLHLNDVPVLCFKMHDKHAGNVIPVKLTESITKTLTCNSNFVAILPSSACEVFGIIADDTPESLIAYFSQDAYVHRGNYKSKEFSIISYEPPVDEPEEEEDEEDDGVPTDLDEDGEVIVAKPAKKKKKKKSEDDDDEWVDPEEIVDEADIKELDAWVEPDIEEEVEPEVVDDPEIS